MTEIVIAAAVDEAAAAAVVVVAEAAAVARAAAANATDGARLQHERGRREPTIEKTVLDSGIRVVTERMPGSKSVAIGFWVGVGSRDEDSSVAGASHFLEHLLFKGTAERSARSIAMAVDAVGGEINAYTSREHTTYYARLPATKLRFGLELLTDVLTQPAFRPDEIDAEREVILEEILMNDDTPDDVVHAMLYEALFPDHPLGRETLGSPETISSMRRDQISSFFERWYRPANLIVAAAGDLDHNAVADYVAHRFADNELGEPPRRHAPDREPERLRVVTRPTEQAHVAMGWRALAHGHPDRYALWVANHVFGGGLSSRLFQEVREERGLVYTIGSSPAAYSDTGSVVLYAGTMPSRIGELFDVIESIISALREHGITETEHEVATGFLEGSLLLGLEDSGSRMMRLGSSETALGEVTSIEEHIERIRAVTVEDVTRVLGEVFDSPRSVAVVGPFDAS
ncbi:MAG: insulinase family protein, partial [Acidimicrobiales bacterium]|nr:insulinase family protein [Acidimicrobiales bacterium]